MTRKISAAGLDLIKQFESFVPFWYDDLAPAKGVPYGYRAWQGGKPKGTLTIGYGHTAAARHPMKPKVGQTINEAAAREILDVDLDECEADVNRLIKVPLSQAQFDALVSFQFNTGALGKSTLLKRLNRGEYTAVPSELMKYVFSKGQRLRGLERRRRAEVDLWNSGEAENDEAGATVIGEAPPVNDPLSKSRTAQGAGLAAAGGMATVAIETKAALDDARSHLEAKDLISITIAVLIIAGALYAFYARWRDGGGLWPWEKSA